MTFAHQTLKRRRNRSLRRQRPLLALSKHGSQQPWHSRNQISLSFQGGHRAASQLLIPASNGFVGEIYTLQGMWTVSPVEFLTKGGTGELLRRPTTIKLHPLPIGSWNVGDETRWTALILVFDWKFISTIISPVNLLFIQSLTSIHLLHSLQLRCLLQLLHSLHSWSVIL